MFSMAPSKSSNAPTKGIVSDKGVPWTEPGSEIIKFYAGKTIFLTGATGTLGKAILEKLLRSCCQLQMIYVLIRSKKDQNPTERLKKLLECEIFVKVAAFNPTYKNQVRLFEGNLEEEDLGLKLSDKKLLAETVEIVIHCGATVKLEEKIRRAAFVNTRSTRDLLRLSQNMKNLKCFAYVSTAYSNSMFEKPEERVYDCQMTCQELVEFVENKPEDILEKMVPKLLGEFPNTYCFSKAIAENTVLKEGKGLTRVIIKPSLIMGFLKEPLPGWVDNIYGPIGTSVAAYIGLSHVGWHELDFIQDLVPLDYEVNSVLACTWDTCINNKECEMPVYSSTTSSQNPITFGDYIYWTDRFTKAIPVNRQLWHWSYFTTKSKLVYRFVAFFLHTLFAMFLDFILKLRGEEPIVSKAIRKLDSLVESTEFFKSKSFCFDNHNMRALNLRMTPKDRQIFYIDVREINWHSAIFTWILGAKKYLFKEEVDLKNFRLHAKRQEMLRNVHYGVISVVISAILLIIYCLAFL